VSTEKTLISKEIEEKMGQIIANNHEFGTAFLVNSKFNHMVKKCAPLSK
jgi:hypothetical protein